MALRSNCCHTTVKSMSILQDHVINHQCTATYLSSQTNALAIELLAGVARAFLNFWASDRSKEY